MKDHFRPTGLLWLDLYQMHQVSWEDLRVLISPQGPKHLLTLPVKEQRK